MERRVKEDKEEYSEKFSDAAKNICSQVSMEHDFSNDVQGAGERGWKHANLGPIHKTILYQEDLAADISAFLSSRFKVLSISQSRDTFGSPEMVRRLRIAFVAFWSYLGVMSLNVSRVKKESVFQVFDSQKKKQKVSPSKLKHFLKDWRWT